MALLGLLATLLTDTAYTWVRLLAALSLSIVLGLFLGIYAAVSGRAERILIPLFDVLQTLPILAFFPFVVYVIVAAVPGYAGINFAVVFLIIVNMLWNIAFGAYEAVKALPGEVIEVASLYSMGAFERLRKMYVPAAMPRVLDQSVLSWAVGLFYLVTSEIFSTGSAVYSVKHGIGVELTSLALSGNTAQYAMGIAVFIVFVVLTRFLIFAPLRRHFNRFNEEHVVKAKNAKRTVLSMEMDAIEHLVRRPRLQIKVRPKHVIAAYAGAAPGRMPAAAAPNAGKREALLVALGAAIIIIAALAWAISTGIGAGLVSYEQLVLVSLGASFVRVWSMFAVVVLVAVPLSVYLLFMSRHAERYLLLFQVMASIPATMMLPLIVSSLRGMPFHSELVALAIFFFSAIWYMLFGILADRSSIHSTMFEVRDIFHVRGINAWKSIYMRAIVPGLITGGITAVAAEWNASIVGEYFTSSAVSAGTVITSVHTGIGVLLDTALQAGNLGLMALALINLTILILLINRLVWHRLYDRIPRVYR